MKKTIGILAFAAILGCNHPNAVPAEKNMSATKDSTESKLAQLNFASNKDLSCGMPVSAGVSDTATYKGKLYGFCSAECKADFLQHADSLLKAK